MLAERIAALPLAELAAQGATLEGNLQPGDLPRLAGLVAGREAGGFQVRVTLRRGPENLPVVRMEITGSLALPCQRCLAGVDWPVDIDVVLTAVADDAAAGELQQPFDSVLLDDHGGLALRAVIEDEILAALPMAPVHADPADCGRRAEAGRQEEREPVQHPFAGLAELLGRSRPDGGKG